MGPIPQEITAKATQRASTVMTLSLDELLPSPLPHPSPPARKVVASRVKILTMRRWNP
jgi:hypothetical protein